MRQIGDALPTVPVVTSVPRLAAVAARTVETFPFASSNSGGFDVDVQTWDFLARAPLVFDQFTLAPAGMAGRQIEFLVGGAVVAAGVLGAGATLTLAAPVQVATGETLRVQLTRAPGAEDVYVRQNNGFTRGADVAGGALTYTASSRNPYAPAMRFTLGTALPKGVTGPLDPSDFPVVTSQGALLPGQVALLDNGTDPPRLVRRRLDGSVPPFANAVSEWPVFVGFMETSDAAGTPPTQVITGPGFQRLNVLAQDDPHGDFNNTTHAWTCPQTGTYHIEMKLRLMDGTPPGIGFGYGADLYERDSPSFLWVTTQQASRQGAPPNQRLMRLTAGQQIVMFLYWDGSAPNGSANIKSAEITIVRQR